MYENFAEAVVGKGLALDPGVSFSAGAASIEREAADEERQGRVAAEEMIKARLKVRVTPLVDSGQRSAPPERADGNGGGEEVLADLQDDLVSPKDVRSVVLGERGADSTVNALGRTVSHEDRPAAAM